MSNCVSLSTPSVRSGYEPSKAPASTVNAVYTAPARFPVIR